MRLSIVLTTVLCLLVYLTGIANHDVWTPDEPRELQMAIEMSREGSWLIPMLSREPFVEKPPLYYWVSAAAQIWFDFAGNRAAVGRMVSSLFSLMTAVLVWLFARSVLSGSAAWNSAWILTTCAGFWELSHWIRIDSVLSFLVAGAVLLYVYAYHSGSHVWIAAACVFAAGAFLTKGFVAWTLIFMPWIALIYLNRKTEVKRMKYHLSGLLFLLGLPGIWMILFYRRAGTVLWNEWFWENQIGRFLGKTNHLGHIHGPGYYLGQLPLILIPWTPVLVLFFIRLLPRYRKNLPALKTGVLTALSVWIIGGFLLLSAAGTKRTIYLYPLLPGFVLLMTATLQSTPRWLSRYLHVISLFFLIVGFGLLWLTPETVTTWNSTGKFHVSTLALQPTAMLVFAITILAWFTSKQCNVRKAATATAGFFIITSLTVIPAVEAFKNYETLFSGITSNISPEIQPHVCGWNLDQTSRALFPYYTGWTIPVVRDAGRLKSILEGDDLQYRFIIIQKEKKFPPPELKDTVYQVVLTSKSMTRRELVLIRGVPGSPSDPETGTQR